MNIDIKTLLLDSLSTKKTTRGSRRLYFSKSCFIIRYEVKGKILKITNIKKTSGRHSTWRQRSKRRYRIIRWYQVKVKKYLRNANQLAVGDSREPVMSLSFSDIQTLIIDSAMLESKGMQTMESHELTKTGATLSFTDVQSLNIHNIKQETKQIQTLKSRLPPKTRAIATETKNITVLRTTAQQTIASPRYNLKRWSARGLLSSSNPKATIAVSSKSCQTELNNEARGIQCQPLSAVASIQTDQYNFKCCSTQISEDLLNIESIESTATTSISNLAEKEVVIYMLNEIGELVINQSQILNNNTQMLGQLSEMSMLAKTLAKGNAWSKRNSCIKKKKRKSPLEKFRKIQLSLDTCTAESAVLPKDIFDKRHKFMQTEQTVPPEIFEKCTQTTFDLIKLRKLSFLTTQL